MVEQDEEWDDGIEVCRPCYSDNPPPDRVASIQLWVHHSACISAQRMLDRNVDLLHNDGGCGAKEGIDYDSFFDDDDPLYANPMPSLVDVAGFSMGH
jgi:hypothetical protein